MPVEKKRIINNATIIKEKSIFIIDLFWRSFCFRFNWSNLFIYLLLCFQVVLVEPCLIANYDGFQRVGLFRAWESISLTTFILCCFCENSDLFEQFEQTHGLLHFLIPLTQDLWYRRMKYQLERQYLIIVFFATQNLTYAWIELKWKIKEQ